MIRGGYGMFYGRIINSTISNAITNVGSTAGQLSLHRCRHLSRRAGVPERPGERIGDAGPARRRRVRRRHTESARSTSTTSIFEQRIADNTMVSVSYVGSAGRNLPLFIDANLPAPSGTVTYAAIGGPLDGQSVTTPLFTGARPNPNFGRITTVSDIVESKYNGLVLQLNRRLTEGLQFQASYTEARATDNGQSSQTFTSSNNVLNPYDLGARRRHVELRDPAPLRRQRHLEPPLGTEGSTTNSILSGFTIAPTLVMTFGPALHGDADRQHAEYRPRSPPVFSAPADRTACHRSRATPISCRKTADVDLRVSRGFAILGTQSIEASSTSST